MPQRLVSVPFRFESQLLVALKLVGYAQNSKQKLPVPNVNAALLGTVK
jgi:hypothetical protein